MSPQHPPRRKWQSPEKMVNPEAHSQFVGLTAKQDMMKEFHNILLKTLTVEVQGLPNHHPGTEECNM
jgi:hypothetical protein